MMMMNIKSSYLCYRRCYLFCPLALWITGASRGTGSSFYTCNRSYCIPESNRPTQAVSAALTSRSLPHYNRHNHLHQYYSSQSASRSNHHPTLTSLFISNTNVRGQNSSTWRRRTTSFLSEKTKLMSTTTGTGTASSTPSIDDTATRTDSSMKPEQKQFRVAMCQFHVTEDKARNIQTCSTYIDRAVSSSPSSSNDNKKTVDLIVLPEIWNSPYATAAFSEYAEPIPSDDNVQEVTSPSVYLLQQKAIQHQIYIVGGSIPEIDTNNQLLYNTCLVFHPTGRIIAKHRKVHLFDIDVPNGITFRESDTLSSGSQITSFPTPWCNIGVGICYDIRFPEYALLLSKTCQLLIYPGAFNCITGPAHWELLQRARAVDTQCYVVTASPARNVPPPVVSDGDNNSNNRYPPYSAWGHSTVVAPWGDIIATTDETESIVVADIDMTNVDRMRQSIPVRDQKRTDLYTLDTKKRIL